MHDDEIWRRVDAQRADLADVLDTLSPEQWSTQSLCQDWTVRDVAAHLTHTATSWLRFGVEAARSGFRFDPMVSRLARSDTRSPDAIAAALRAMVGVRRRPPGTKVVDPLLDLLVHGQDIAVPLGLNRVMPVDASVAAAERLWGMTFPLNPRKRFGAVELVATDVNFAVGSGRRISGAIADIVLALAGRQVGLDGLSAARGPLTTTE
jgi:uncharacterized protein (TIGR03083 family)